MVLRLIKMKHVRRFMVFWPPCCCLCVARRYSLQYCEVFEHTVSGRVPIELYLPGWAEGLRKSAKTVSRDSRSPGRDSKQTYSEYKCRPDRSFEGVRGRRIRGRSAVSDGNLRRLCGRGDFRRQSPKIKNFRAILRICSCLSNCLYKIVISIR